MSDIEATKFYVRHREDYPETEVQDYARRGFWAFGVEVVPYHGFGDLDEIADLGPTVGIAGYIDDVKRGLERLGRPAPVNVDYPPELAIYLGRTITQTTLGAVRQTPGPVFIKPVEQKLFTGFVWQLANIEARRRVVMHGDDVEVYACPEVAFASEYRAFILDDEILDVRIYRGDWSLAPSGHNLRSAVWALKGKAPRAYCLDWAVDAEGRTLLVEMNEGFAFGHYGLKPTLYARMLSARWHQLTTG